jgi:hypothetical protein
MRFCAYFWTHRNPAWEPPPLESLYLAFFRGAPRSPGLLAGDAEVEHLQLLVQQTEVEIRQGHATAIHSLPHRILLRAYG